MNIYERLKNYRVNKCRVDELERCLRNIDNELIEGLALPAVVISDMPKSVTNKINNPTCNISTAYDQEKTSILRELNTLKNEIESIDKACQNGLFKKEKYIIEKKYFDGFNWDEILIEFCEKFPLSTNVGKNVIVQNYVYTTKQTLYKKHNSAIYKLKKILEGSVKK